MDARYEKRAGHVRLKKGDSEEQRRWLQAGKERTYWALRTGEQGMT